MREYLIAGTVVVAIAVSGCGGDDGQKQASAPGTAQTTTTQSTATTDSTTPTTPTTPSTKQSAGKGKGGATTSPGTSGSSGSGGVAQAPPASKSKGSGGTSGTFAPASGAETQAVTAAVTGFYSALADGEGDKACALLASRVTRSLDKSLSSSPELKGKDCGDVLTLASKNYPEQFRQRLRQLHIKSVSANGDKAIAAYAGDGAKTAKITVVREGGDWKVAAFKGAPPALKG